MATSSIFTDFSIKDKKTARAFVKAWEESAKAKRPRSGVEHTILADSSAIRERFSNDVVNSHSLNARNRRRMQAYHRLEALREKMAALKIEVGDINTEMDAAMQEKYGD